MILNIILFIIIIFITYLLILSLRKINQYEDFILQISSIIEFSTKKMKQVDSTGHYESDDETGFFFEQLKDIQLLLDSIFETNEETIDAKKKN